MIHVGDCRSVLPTLPAESFDAIVTDPPYEVGIMSKGWDRSGVAYDVTTWREALRVAKPGAYLVAFGSTRTSHRVACAIEDAGWEIRDSLMWCYGSGFPKSRDVSIDLDRIAGLGPVRDRALRFTAWMRTTGLTAGQINRATGTFMASHYLTDGEQPAVPTRDLFEKIRPLLAEPVPQDIEDLVDARIAEELNLQARPVVGQHAKGAPGAEWRERYGGGPSAGPASITAALTDEAKRWQGFGTALKPAWEPIILARKPTLDDVAGNLLRHGCGALNIDGCRIEHPDALGRWPANLVHDGSDEVVHLFPNEGGASTARFFYCAKASPDDRHDGVDRNDHATVKPTRLMRWLVRLVTPPRGRVLDLFTGSGTTGRAAIAEGMEFEGVELEPANAELARRRIYVVQPGLGL